MEIRALRSTDDRSTFESGSPALDVFLHKYAGQNQFRHHVGVTYVAVEGHEIHGYVSVSPAHVEIDALPAAVRKKLPRYPLPVLRLARLAVARSVQGQGVGRHLLRFVLSLAVRMADELGCVGVVVDAKPDAIPFYRRFGFIPLEALEGQADERPQPVPMLLATRAIRGARPA
jgi:predicted N-acetyltransferase YhbS